MRRLAASIAAIGFALSAAAFAAPNQAGVIDLADGDARISSPGAEARKAKIGDAVNEGDLLLTGKDGEIHLKMQDSGFMVVRPNTRFQIVGYAADGDEKDKGVFRLIAGGVRSITGWIGKFNPRNYQIQTANATVGIRGTDHETRFIPEGSTEGEPGTYDRVYEGETVLETADGKATIAKDQSGYLSNRPRDRPRRLAAVPGFYRPGPHEAAIARKHAEIQQMLAERREERRKILQERRAMAEELKGKASQLKERAAELTPAQKRELRAKREALQRDVKAAKELHEDIAQSRKSLEEDVKAGRIPKAEARDRRKALQEKERAFTAAQESINQRMKDLNETADSILK